MPINYDLRAGDSLSFDGGKIVVTLREKSGQVAKVTVNCDEAVAVVKNKGTAMATPAAQQGVVRPK